MEDEILKTVTATISPEKMIEDMVSDKKRIEIMDRLNSLKAALDLAEATIVDRNNQLERGESDESRSFPESENSVKVYSASEMRSVIEMCSKINDNLRDNLKAVHSVGALPEVISRIEAINKVELLYARLLDQMIG